MSRYIIAVNYLSLDNYSWSSDGKTGHYVLSHQEDCPGPEYDPDSQPDPGTVPGYDPAVEVDPGEGGIVISAPDYDCPLETERILVKTEKHGYQEYFLIQEEDFPAWCDWVDNRDLDD